MSGTFPDELCGVGYCFATSRGNPDLVAPCGTGSCCDFGERPSCPSTPTTPKPTLLPTTPKPTLLPTPTPAATDKPTDKPSVSPAPAPPEPLHDSPRECETRGLSLGASFDTVVEALEFAAQQNCKHIMWSPLYHKQWGSHCCVDDGLNGRANSYYEVYAVPSAEGLSPTPAPSFLANDWWKQHFADGKIPSGTNLDAPAGYVAIEGAGPCMCRNPGWNLDSCGKLCCRGSPYTDPDPNGQYYIGKHKNGRICYKPEGAEYKDGDGGNSSGTASLAIIIPVVVAAVLLLAAVLFLVRKRVVAARQHRRESMPTVGDDKAEVEA